MYSDAAAGARRPDHKDKKTPRRLAGVTRYIEMRYVRKNTIEHREYQVNVAEQASRENCVVVLPTGLGKTAVALQVIASHMASCSDDGPAAVLFLAPTRVLVNQHHEFLQNALTIDDISIVTGEDAAARRKKLWGASVVCATPEIARNDLRRGMISPDTFGLVIFDEAHRTVGDYAYSAIAQMLEPAGPRILGMTATLPSDKDRATEIMARLHIASVAERNESSPDVRPYVQKTETEWFQVDLTPELREMQSLLKRALKSRCETLRARRVSVGEDPSLSSLLRLRDYVLRRNRGAATPLFAAIRIHYALSILEAHGITPFLKFCERARKKKGSGARALFEADADFGQALRLADRAKRDGIEHPKIAKLTELVGGIDGKILIFTSYRDSVDMICEALDGMGVSSGKLIGKAGQTGLKQKQQVEAVRRFRDGEFRIMVATRVGEEGLDISEVNHVIFYDNVPSSIRYVQRRGRTGRRTVGRLIVLIAKGTIDETYYWIGKRKIKIAESMGGTMSGMLDLNRQDGDGDDDAVAVGDDYDDDDGDADDGVSDNGGRGRASARGASGAKQPAAEGGLDEYL